MNDDILSNLEASVELDLVDKGNAQVFQQMNDSLQEVKEAPTQMIASIPDAAIGSAMAGQAANALTPKLEQQAMKQGMTKLAPFLARHVAPRVIGGMAGSTMGPVGTVAGAIAPELGYQALNALQSMPVAPQQVATPQAQYIPAMDMVAAQNPQLAGTPEIFKRAMQGPGVGYTPASQYSPNFLQLP